MCIIPYARLGGEINWIQDIVYLHPDEKFSEQDDEYGFAEIFSTIGIRATEDDVSIDLVIPRLEDEPKKQCHTLFDEEHWIKKLYNKIDRDSHQRKFDFDTEHKALSVKFQYDSKYKNQTFPYELINTDVVKTEFWPSEKEIEDTLKEKNVVPFVVYTIKNIQRGGYVFRISYRVRKNKEINNSYWFNFRGAEAAEFDIKSDIFKIKDNNLKEIYTDKVYKLSELKQSPQRDIYTLIHMKKNRYEYKNEEFDTYDPAYILTHEGADDCLPKGGEKTLKFKIKSENPGELESPVKIFFPKDDKFRIDIILHSTKCLFHEDLWKNNVRKVI